MADRAFRYDNVKPPPREEDWQSPANVFFDDLSFSFTVPVAAADNDRIRLFLRTPLDESWLIHQFRVYNSLSEAFDIVSIQLLRPGREIDLTGAGQWALTTGPVSTYNMFYSATGGAGSVTWGIDSTNFKQPPYIGPGCKFLLEFYVNVALGWTINNVVTWQLIVDRIPEVGKAALAPEEILARLSVLPFGGKFK